MGENEAEEPPFNLLSLHVGKERIWMCSVYRDGSLISPTAVYVCDKKRTQIEWGERGRRRANGMGIPLSMGVYLIGGK